MTLLLALPLDRCRSLIPKLKRPATHILTADNCRRAKQLLMSDARIELVITALSFRDGNWCDVVKCVVDGGYPAEIVVSSPTPSQTLWSEVIWRGGYDLLLEPYDPDDVERVVEGAIRAARTLSSQTDNRCQMAAA